jgi:chromosomal replication initiation ATPase DnaA
MKAFYISIKHGKPVVVISDSEEGALKAVPDLTQKVVLKLDEVNADVIVDKESVDSLSSITPYDIASVICSRFGITIGQIRTRNQSDHVNKVRKLISLAIRDILGTPHSEIGDLIHRGKSATCTALQLFRKYVRESGPGDQYVIALNEVKEIFSGSR